MGGDNILRDMVCKSGLRIMAVILVTTILITGVSRLTIGEAAVNALNPLFETLAAGRFTAVKDWERVKDLDQPLTLVKGVFRGESEAGAWVGIIVQLESPGYAGPVKILVAFDPEGKITKVNVYRHNETDCHIIGMTKGNFLEQFKGISFFHQLRMLIGVKPEKTGDIQAMTSGTITSRAVTVAVSEARVVMYRLQK